MIVDAMTHGMTEQVIGQDNIWIGHRLWRMKRETGEKGAARKL